MFIYNLIKKIIVGIEMYVQVFFLQIKRWLMFQVWAVSHWAV
jgi:hypothetical protein